MEAAGLTTHPTEWHPVKFEAWVVKYPDVDVLRPTERSWLANVLGAGTDLNEPHICFDSKKETNPEVGWAVQARPYLPT